MAKNSGQTLVEFAVVLPCFALGIFTGVQLICYCHNMIELQRMAQITIDRPSASRVREYWRFHGLWGRYRGEKIRPRTQRAAPWRHHKGLKTLREPGVFSQARISAQLLPGEGFSRALAPVTQKSYAQTYWEAPTPQER